jgi:hypothetical protein
MMIDARALHRRWMHSHEEDSEDEAVYRPSSWRFPASRGRSGFELRADGTATRLAPGAADRPQEAAGRWRLEADDLVLESPGQVARVLRVLRVEPDRLVVRK